MNTIMSDQSMENNEQSYIEYLEKNIELYKDLFERGKEHPEASEIVAQYNGKRLAFSDALEVYKKTISVETPTQNKELAQKAENLERGLR